MPLAANSQKNPQFNIKHHSLLRTTANAPPQMLLDNSEFTTYMSSLLKKESQNGPNRHVLEESLEVITCQATPHGNPKTAGSTVLNRLGTIQEPPNKL